MKKTKANTKTKRAQGWQMAMDALTAFEADTKPGRKAEFIRRLAAYLTHDQAKMSIMLQMGRPEAKAWADLRSATPLFGYPTPAEAEKVLKEFLW